jgi:hypothetical protein
LRITCNPEVKICLRHGTTATTDVRREARLESRRVARTALIVGVRLGIRAVRFHGDRQRDISVRCRLTPATEGLRPFPAFSCSPKIASPRNMRERYVSRLAVPQYVLRRRRVSPLLRADHQTLATRIVMQVVDLLPPRGGDDIVVHVVAVALALRRQNIPAVTELLCRRHTIQCRRHPAKMPFRRHAKA